MEHSREYRNGNTLRDYQLEGVNWLLFNWYNRSVLDNKCLLHLDVTAVDDVKYTLTLHGQMYCHYFFALANV